MSKKSQISIFIIIAIAIIFLLIFMMSTDFDDKKDDLSKDKAIIKSKGGDDLIFIKTMVDGCLEKQLRKATITAGLRGGFIFDKGEYYYPGTIPDETYTPRLISNLDLNWNNLESKSLVHSQAQVHTPGIDSNNSFFSHSIKEDFEKFISIEFMNCLEFDDYEDIYLINYTDYLGNIDTIDFNSKKILISGLDAHLEDEIKINFIDEDLIGVVKRVDGEKFLVEFDNLNYLKSLDVDFLKNLSVTNLDKGLHLNITFNDENIRASIKYPVTIVNKEFSSLYEDSEVTIEVRFKKLIEFSKVVLNYKYLENKSVNFLGSNNLIKALNSSNYFKKKGLSGIDFRMRVINETLSEKKYLYSIIDKDSKILGNPYVFNFGYENIAPIVNFTAIDPAFDYDTKNNVITLIATKNQPISYRLEPYTTEYQYWDHYIKYFEEFEYDGPDAHFKLDRDGNLSFTPYMEKVYTYNLRVTDTEAQREHTLIFITGFPDNTDNQAAMDCFKFENYQDPLLFPIVNSYENKIFDKINSGSGMHKPFAYSLYSDNENLEGSKLFFMAACTFMSPSFKVDAKLSYDGITTTQSDIFALDNGGEIEIPYVNSPIEVEVIVTRNGDSIVDPAFSMTIYPAACLGPFARNISDVEWDMTCCNLDKISQTDPESYIGSMTNLYNPGDGENHFAIDDDFLFVVDFEHGSSLNYDFENNIFWDEFGPNSTSVYTGHMGARCKGEYPTLEKNIEDITPIGSPVKSFGITRRVDDGIRQGVEIGLDPISVTLGRDTSAGVCEFGYASNLSLRFFFDNDFVLSAGLISSQSGANSYGLTYIPDEAEYDDLYVLCDDNLVASSDNGLTWGTSAGEDMKGKIYTSKKYCAQGSNECKERIINPLSPDNKRDDNIVGKCNDYFFVTPDFKSKMGSSSIFCSAGEYCSSGNCIAIP